MREPTRLRATPLSPWPPWCHWLSWHWSPCWPRGSGWPFPAVTTQPTSGAARGRSPSLARSELPVPGPPRPPTHAGHGRPACGNASHQNGSCGAGCLPGERGWGVRGRCQGITQLRYLVQVRALSNPAAQTGGPWRCSEPQCHAGTTALPGIAGIPREALCCSQTPTPTLPRALLALLLFQHKTAFQLIPP